jgi:hypothetical protein
VNTFSLFDWQHNPPVRVVIGCGVYAHALAQVLDAGFVPAAALEAPLGQNDSARLLTSMNRLLMVADSNGRTADMLWRYEKFLTWVKRLTSDKEFHMFGTVFVLTEDWADETARDLAGGLGFEAFGHRKGAVVWRRSQSLSSLLSNLEMLKPTDVQHVESHQANAPRRRALVHLKKAISAGDAGQVLNAARAAANEFRGKEILLDHFCQPPFHAPGGRWRSWIRDVVTNGVTPERQKEGEELLSVLRC